MRIVNVRSSLRRILFLSYLCANLKILLAIPALIPTAIIVGSSILIETYIRIPQRLLFGSNPPLLPLEQDAINSYFLIFPGYGGPDANTGIIS